MELFADIALVMCRRARRSVGCDGVIPESESGKNMRRHVQGMWCRRSDLRIRACCREPLLRQLRAVGGVDHVVREAGMLRMRAIQRFENRQRFLLIGMR